MMQNKSNQKKKPGGGLAWQRYWKQGVLGIAVIGLLILGGTFVLRSGGGDDQGNQKAPEDNSSAELKKGNPGQEESTQAETALTRILKELEASMVTVEGGSFEMGCTSEQDSCFEIENPVHVVNLNGFQISKFEVTQEQWRVIMGGDPLGLKFTGCDVCPVESVSWNDVHRFLKKLNQLTGKAYRLPSESEWEYAARGGRQRIGFPYSGSKTLKDVGWYKENSDGKTQPVGRLKPNESGLFDMNGNVKEWCQDMFHNGYEGAPDDGSAWEDKGDARVVRGGSWFSRARFCRVASRDYWLPDHQGSDVGFRLAHP